MSNFSTVYDYLIATTIPGLTGFSTKTEIIDPYNIENNDINFLKNGWGIRELGSSESDFNEMNFTRVDQGFGIVLTRVHQATKHNVTPLHTAVKNLIEDSVLIRKDFYNWDQLTLDSNIENIIFTGRDAIEFLAAEEGYSILYTVVKFDFTLKESI